jgi:aminoglycoside 2'-N-acetyltransferase I
MNIVIKADGDLNEVERQEMDRAVDAAFLAAEDDGGGITWVEKNDWHVLVLEDDRVVSHVGIVERTVTVEGQPLRVGGIGAVATMPKMQGRGLASAAMRHAGEYLREALKVDFGLLVCGPKVEPLYARLGWKMISSPVLVDQPGGKKVNLPGVIMILPCVKQDWPEGTIDLCGLPW